jgi:HSP20 family molecular chaperone IbpA
MNLRSNPMSERIAKPTRNRLDKGRLQTHERFEREFERRFVLPAAVDTEHMKATFAKDVLEVHAPKALKGDAEEGAVT